MYAGSHRKAKRPAKRPTKRLTQRGRRAQFRPTPARAGCSPNFSVRDKLDGRGALFLGADETKNLLAAACPDTHRNQQVFLFGPMTKSTEKRFNALASAQAQALRRAADACALVWALLEGVSRA